MNENDLSNKVINAAIKVHKNLGPGLLESVYQECLYYELTKLSLIVAKQQPIPLTYESIKLEVGFRLDLIIESKLIVEIKSIEAINDIHLAQILTYLKLTNCKLGLIINFNVSQLRLGIKRVINGHL